MPDAHRVHVVERTIIGTDVAVLRLRGTGPLPPWSPGAHIDVVLPSGPVRQYSLCGPADAADEYSIAVLLQPDGRGGSVEVHQKIDVGTELTITGPRNRFELVDARGYVFIAGGIGITPLLPMVEQVAAAGVPWRLVYGGRSRSSMAFLDRLEPWADRVHVIAEDEQGRIDVPAVLATAGDSAVYVCGPSGLIDAVVDGCDSDSVYFERFSGVEVSTGQDRAFEVQFGPGGPVLPVPADQSILAAVLAAGADVLYSCEEGSCGSCDTMVLDGDVDHRDTALTEAERAAGSMLICVSRAACSRLVLDIEPPHSLR